jgi:hypothetical protein
MRGEGLYLFKLGFQKRIEINPRILKTSMDIYTTPHPSSPHLLSVNNDFYINNFFNKNLIILL